MSMLKRLKRPIAAQIELPDKIPVVCWREVCNSLLHAGVSFFNLTIGQDIESALALALCLRKRADIALSMPISTHIPPRLLTDLIPCTIRVILDTAKRPSQQLRDWVRGLSETNGIALVAVGALPGTNVVKDWLQLFRSGLFVAFNVEDIDCLTIAAYSQFLGRMAEFHCLCSVPVISDLPLVTRFKRGEPDLAGMCPAGRISLYISSDGIAKPCKKARLELGTVFKADMLELWNDPRLAEWATPPNECLSCAIKTCLGGCRARAASRGRDRLCPGPA